MLSEEKTMEVLEAYDLVKTYRCAAQLCGVDHHTVARAVADRAAGKEPSEPPVRARSADAFITKVEEWVERSSGKVRADVVHERLLAMGYVGSERTTRRVVAVVKKAHAFRSHRVYKPWVPEPGLWLQYDFGKGPRVGGAQTILFCSWLAWSRFRFITPLLDRSMASVITALDRALRLMGGAPTYVLTDNEKTVTDRHIAGIAVRNQLAVSVSAYYGLSLCTCVPYDPETKGGSESTVKLAKADLVPTDANLLDDYTSFAELEAACSAHSAVLNNRPHSVTRMVPALALATERGFLHPIPDVAYAAAFGESRSVGWSCTICYYGARYSVPHEHCGTRVWARTEADQVVIVAGEGSGAREVARHTKLGPGQTSLKDEHFPAQTGSGRPVRRPRATNPDEERFLALGEGAARYLVEAAATGARRIEARMSQAVALARLHSPSAVDDALGLAAFAGRFGEGDIESILVHAKGAVTGAATPPAEHSLAQGTGAWSVLGATEAEGEDK
ncbi:MAG TPA: IS21 family transposase [Acidimicrobiales bacterium]|nr:IS21 family transposase [Acidimicrobiales bacterium]